MGEKVLIKAFWSLNLCTVNAVVIWGSSIQTCVVMPRHAAVTLLIAECICPSRCRALLTPTDFSIPGFLFVSSMQMCHCTDPEFVFLCQQFTLESKARFSGWISNKCSVWLHLKASFSASLGLPSSEFTVTFAFCLFGSLLSCSVLKPGFDYS